MMDLNRIQRETEFHNNRFSHDQRSALNKFYKITQRSFGYQKELIGRYGKNGILLDYGCGAGEMALSEAPDVLGITGIDISQVAIDKASEKAIEQGVSSKTKFMVMNAENLEFPDSTFDLVYGTAILHHLDLGRAYAEIARVLKPSGRAIFWEPMGHNPLINMFRTRTPEMRTADEHPLLRKDVVEARKYFKNVDMKFFHFAEIGTAFVGGTFLEHPVRWVFSIIDRILLNRFSPLKYWAWVCVLDLEK